MVNGKKVGFISLGCDKNRVDTEKMIAVIAERHEITSDINEAQIVVINTCAFIESARKEAISEIANAISLKNAGKIEKIIVTGCLSQRYEKALFDGFPEADAIIGVSEYSSVNEIIDRVYGEERVLAVECPHNERLTARKVSTDGYAYLKIADGCSNRCTYCAIPYIRGAYRSVPESALLQEVKSLGEVNELILVAQDVTKYGSDLKDGTDIVKLLRDLSALSEVRKIRLLYCYPESVTDDLIDEIARNDKIIKYIDVPFQHASDPVLKRMNRKGTYLSNLALVNKLKERIEGVAIRSTFLVGFPGETEEDFATLINFVKEAKLFNIGVFAYSVEEGTPASKLKEQLSAPVKRSRVKKLYAAQKKTLKEVCSPLIGQEYGVTVEGFDETSGYYYGRAYFNAPDIDGKVFFISEKGAEKGRTVTVKTTAFKDYDFYGERVEK